MRRGVSIADELGKLEALRQSGTLSDAEFAAAKQRLLASNAPDSTIGRAANRYVSFQIVAAGVGLVVFLVFLFAVFLPMLNMIQGFVARMPLP
jgi:hypothetical protein